MWCRSLLQKGDGEESVASWELRVEGRLLEDVSNLIVIVLWKCSDLTTVLFFNCSGGFISLNNTDNAKTLAF